ncbi:MAG TPA: hypothetical protein VMI54_07020 [Polyangiaceae bacterium]|nr:hypothetical protein [Polyangiaceae bacterium]
MLGRSRVEAAFFAALAAGAVSLAAVRANAQSGTEESLADTLYRQARELSAAGNFAEACPKFAESYRLDPGTGTLLNLASCHESLGMLATAWVEFNDALVQSRRDRRQSRIDYAEEHIDELTPKLSRLTVTLAASADQDGLELSMDGVVVGVAALGVPTPLDPGPHTIEAKAPGKKPWSATVTIGAVSDQQTLVIPALEALPPAPVAAPPPVVAPAPSPPPLAPAAPPADLARERPVPTSVYVAGGATIALALAASITGGVYLDHRSTYDATGRNDADRAAAKSDHDSLVTLGVVNLVLWIAAAGGAGATTYLYVTRPEVPAAHTGLTLTPWASANGAGLYAGGTL